jgi:uncharacterized protein YecE (DUF72 family)
MTDPFRIGTAGWNVPSVYIDQVPRGGSHLERYARTFNTVEINSSFYRPHRRTTYERWTQAVPDDFRFSVKVPKAITHDARLVNCAALLDGFLEEAGGLGKKLGVLLLQLPPKSELKKRVANSFFRALRARTGVHLVLEPRHPSWFAPGVGEWLAERRVVRAAADPARVVGAAEPGGWNKLAYYRWHGSPRVYYSQYDAAALTALQRRLKRHRASGVPAWCIFDNTTSGAALGNALELLSSLKT